jgi:splicing factor 3B subunit 1
MNAPGIMMEDQDNCYLSDEKLNAVFPAASNGLCHRGATRMAQMLLWRPASLQNYILYRNSWLGNLAFFKPEDAQYFAKILKEEDETELSVEEMKERKIMCLLLKIRNSTLSVRKTALRQITDKAHDFEAGPLFDKLLPLLMEQTLGGQE